MWMNLIEFLRKNDIVSYYNLDYYHVDRFDLYAGENIDAQLLTDGSLDLSNSYYDDKAYLNDDFIPSNIRALKYEFLISNANFVLIKRNIHGKLIKDLYMGLTYLKQLDITNKTDINVFKIDKEGETKIKTLGVNIWK